MNGKLLGGGLVGFSVIFGIGLWYSQTRAYYYDVFDIAEVSVAGMAVAVTEYEGIDADTSPLKMRACFSVAQSLVSDADVNDTAHPLQGPSRFTCFDAVAIDADLSARNATAIIAGANEPYGFDRIIAQYPDGSAFMWRQINDCGAAAFAGDTLPEHCPPQPEFY